MSGRWLRCGGGGLWSGFLGVCSGRGDVRVEGELDLFGV